MGQVHIHKISCGCGATLEIDGGQYFVRQVQELFDQFYDKHEACIPVEKITDANGEDEALALLTRLVTAVEHLETNVHTLIGALKQ